MKLSELIADAERTLKEFGDIPVVVPNSGCGCCADGNFEVAETRVERDSVRAWLGAQWVDVPTAFIVA
jgi:hypothetical protein